MRTYFAITAAIAFSGVSLAASNDVPGATLGASEMKLIEAAKAGNTIEINSARSSTPT